MDRQALREEVTSRFGDEDHALASKTQVNTWLNLAIRHIWRAWPWAFTRVETTVTTTANQSTVDMPDDYLRVTKLVNEDDGYSLVPRSEKWARRVYVGTEDGQPQYYTDGGVDQSVQTAAPVRRLRLFPTPDRAYTLTLVYNSTPTLPTADDHYPPLPEEFDEAIVTKVLGWYYRKVDDFQQADIQQEEFGQEMSRLIEVYGNWQAERFPLIDIEPATEWP